MKPDFSRRLLAAGILLLIGLYPGQNYLQTLVIRPGMVRSYNVLPLVLPVYPVSDGSNVPRVTAKSVVIQDAETKTLLFSKNPDQILLPASTTKIMTALVSLDHYRLEDVLIIKNEDRAVGSTMELVRGESITVENLLYGLLVDSGNDASLALADNFPGGYDSFLAAMNEKARTLHLDNTVYKNVSGVESYGHETSARDLAVLAAEAVNNPVVNRIMQTKNLTVTDVSGTLSHELNSTNQLLGVVPGVMGLKTGWTQNAGECLVSYVSRDGRSVIIVVLGSLDRFGESTELIDWVFSHHTWRVID